jgi:hypothetical protein
MYAIARLVGATTTAPMMSAAAMIARTKFSILSPPSPFYLLSCSSERKKTPIALKFLELIEE